jgi:spore coat protein CotH
LAQPPGGRGPGRGGFGGPGFGPPGGPASSAMLLRLPEVRKELGTSEPQNKQIDALHAEQQDQMRASFGAINFQELQELSEEERSKRFEEARKKSEQAAKKADEKLASVLDAKQMQRLNQLRLQREGIASFRRPEVVKQLGLTNEQQDKIRKLQPEGPMFFGPGPGGPGGPAQGEKMLGDALAVLTADQKAKWAELKGKEFKFSQGPGGIFGFGPGPMGQQRKLLKQFDKDGDGRLNKDERLAARESLKKDRAVGGRGGFGFGGRGGPGGGGFGPPGFGRGNREPAKPGPRVAPTDVPSYPDKGLYEPTVLRTVFLDFEGKDWEPELADFYHTDVDIPATLTVDGKKYPNVGVRFRGASSYFGVPAGYKRGLNLSLDFVDKKQRLYGYKTLNLLNSHDDPSFLSTVLYSDIARRYIPAPKANLVRLVINGESWGVYVDAQQFNKEFTAENFQSAKGARWKVQGSPGGAGGLDFVGENLDDYKRRYQMKSGSDKDWKALVALCRTLDKTPLDKLEDALKPILDIDGVLWFLALDVALINNDGYWIRASDYNIYRDPKGKFHVIPHDMNEAFQGPMGPGFGFGPGRGRGFAPGGGAGAAASRFGLDPLVGLDDARKPLRSRLLAVPNLRARYLDHVRAIAEDALDWKKLGPVVATYRALIDKELGADTRKLDSLDDFRKAVADVAEPEAGRGGRRPAMSLRAFADQRREYLLNHPEIKKAAVLGGKGDKP